MEFTSVKKFVDFHVENYKKIFGTSDYNSQIMLCDVYKPYGIQVYNGIDILAGVLELDISEVKTDSAEYPYEYKFAYEDVQFFQIKKERLAGYGLSD